MAAEVASFNLTAKIRKIVAVVDLYADNRKVGETEVEVDAWQQQSFSGNSVTVNSPSSSAAMKALAEVFKA